MIKFACTKCGKVISAADEHAGRKAKCPMCQTIQVIPAPAKPAPQQGRPPAKAPPTRAVQAKKPPARPPVDDLEEVEEDFEVVEEAEEEPAEDFEVVEAADEEPEEEERPRRRPKPKKKKRRWHGEWADCPNCGAPGDATRLSWTIWGGFIGPLFINHVRCNECGSTYNGKHGDYNTTRIVIYMAINIGLALVIVCGMIGLGIISEAAK